MEKYSEITSYTFLNYMQNHQFYSFKIIYEILKSSKELSLLKLLIPHSNRNES